MRIFNVTNNVWQEFGIFPEVMERRADVTRIRADVNSQFRKLGTGNLRLLCDELKITLPKEADKSDIAETLLGKFPPDLLVHAFEFYRKRSRAIQEIFNSRYPKSKSLTKRVAQLSTNPRETLDNRTRLLLLLNQSEANLKDIFYLSSWISRDTVFRFNIKNVDETIYSNKIVENLDKLTGLLDTCSDLGGERLGHHDLNGRALVIVHLRKYRPRVYRDYQTTHNLHHVCGTLIIGISHVDSYVHVKSASKNVADAVQRFLEVELDFEVERMEDKVISGFSPQPLSQLLSGRPPEGSRFKLAGIAFSRTSIGNVPLNIPRAPFNDRILTTVETLHDSGIISSASPVYLQSLDLDYKGEQIRVESKHLVGGAIRLTYQNAGLSDTFQEALESDFESSFGVPLSRKLDPSQWAAGTAGIIAFILRAKTKEEIQDYQTGVYAELKKIGILEEKPEEIKACSRFGCKSSSVSDPEAAECKECGSPLKRQNILVIELKPKGLQNWISGLLATDKTWGLGSRTLTFEKQKYFPLISNLDSTSKIAALFQHRVSREKQLAFDRSSLPLVRFSELNESVPLRIERDDSAVVSLPFVLTAHFEVGKRPEIASKVSSLLTRVQASYDSRISRAARLSWECLISPPSDQDGDKYEVDVFNVARWLFWHASRLGKKGQREPDGFISFQDYQDSESPSQLNQWNLGYDAKFSASVDGYDFGPEQHRQASEYIRKYFRAKRQGIKRDLRILGHAIISNSIAYDKIASFVKHLCEERIISVTEASPVIVLIRDEFLSHLYHELSANEELLFRTKRLHLHYLVVRMLEQKTPHMFVEMGRPAADYIVQQLKSLPPIEKKLDIDELLRGCFSVIPASLFTPQCAPPSPYMVTES